MLGVWMTSALLVGAIIELLVGRQGILLPLTAMVCFHFGVMRCFRQALCLGWCAGVALDLAYGRPFPLHLVMIPVIIGLARLWRNYQLTHLLPLQAVPGLFLGLVMGGVPAVVAWFELVKPTGLDALLMLWQAVRCALVSAVGLPLCCWLLDALSDRLGQTRFTKVGAEYLAGARTDVVEVSDDGDQ